MNRIDLPAVARAVPRLPALLLLLCCATAGLAQRPQPLHDLRAADGHYAARDDGMPDAADVRVNVWMLLQFVADGNTLRTGPHRTEMRQLVRWLDTRRDAEGRVGLRADPDWLLEQAMATYVFWELLFDAPDAKTHERAIATLDALVRELERARPAPDLEVQLWCRFVQVAARALPEVRATPASRPVDRVALARSVERGESLERLAAAMGKLGEPKVPAADAPVRLRAAFALWQVLAPEPKPLRELPPWPEDPIADPWCAFYATAAAFAGGGEPRRGNDRRVDAEIEAKVVQRGTRTGEVPPSGAFGDVHGRAGTTAVTNLTRMIPLHYVRLHLFE